MDSYEEIDEIYEGIERKQNKVNRIKEEIKKSKKKKIIFNVFNVVDEQEFEKKVKEDFGHIDYKVQEFNSEDECLVVEVLRNIASDFMILEGESVGPTNLSIYLDEKQTEVHSKSQIKEKPKPHKSQTKENPKVKRERLLKN